MFRRLIFLACTIAFIHTVKAQDYIIYQQVFNRVDEDILDDMPDRALSSLDSIYCNYEFIFARHCVKALQLSIIAGDSIRAEKWLGRAFLQGVPMWMIRANRLSAIVFTYDNTEQTVAQYDSLRARYFSGINKGVANIIDSLLDTDQYLTEKVNSGFVGSRAVNYLFRWRKNNRKSYVAINKIINEYGFPGEQLIGLPPDLQDSGTSYHKYVFYGPLILRDHRAYTMLIHYFSNKRKGFKDNLSQNIKDGYLSPYQYGALYDFMSEYGKEDRYYNVWHTAKDPEKDLAAINKRRMSVGLNTYDAQKRNNSLNMEHRKNKAMENVVLLE